MKKLLFGFTALLLIIPMTACSANAGGNKAHAASISQNKKKAQKKQQNQELAKFIKNLPNGQFEIKHNFKEFPRSVQLYLMNHKKVYVQFVSDPTFNARVVHASWKVIHFDPKDVKYLMNHPKAHIMLALSSFQRVNGKIVLYKDPNLKAAYDQVYNNGLSQKEKKVLAGLSKIGTVFYLKKNGSPVHVKTLDPIGAAKAWSTGATASDLKRVNQKIKAHAPERLAVINHILPLTKGQEFQHLRGTLNVAKSVYTYALNHGFQTETDYVKYYSMARLLFMYNDVLNHKVPVVFSDGINHKLINRLDHN